MDVIDAHQGKDSDDLSRKYAPQDGQHRQNDRHVPKHPLRKGPSFPPRLGPEVPGENRYKRRAERPLPSNAANHIGNPEGQDKRIGHRRGAQQQGHPLIP
jgi:hypothetical protein